MAKGYQANKERQADITNFGKAIGKRAGFACEWCGGKDALRIWDYKPDKEANIDNLALLCGGCRDLANGKQAGENELRSIHNALWSTIPAVVEGAAKVLAQCNESWVRDAIEQSLMDDGMKEQLLAHSKTWK